MVHPALHVGAHAFLSTLGAGVHQHMQAAAAMACSPPPDYVDWWCDGTRLGSLSPERARWLAQHLGDCDMQPKRLVWHAGKRTREQRSAALQQALEQARAQQLLTGWRNERFSFWHSACEVPDPQVSALLDVERAGFRFLGMRSHAVHVNGFLPDGRLWIARRALSKATDPGMLDNMTAGGLPSGETVHNCLLRELAEEAGLHSLQGHVLQTAGRVCTARLEKEGWHDEVLHVFNLTLAPGFVPRNLDGEVAGFLCLAPAEVVQRIEAGEMTVDAVQSLLQGLRSVTES